MNQTNLTRGKGLLENFLAQRRARKADSLILPSYRQGRILDIGCGLVPFFLLQTSFQEKFGIDSSTGDLPDNGEIQIHREAIEKDKPIPYQENFFDVVTMLGVLEHFNHEQAASLFKQVYRVLKPHGRFILTTPHPCTSQLLKVLASISLISRQEIEGIQATYSIDSLRSLLKEANFKHNQTHTGYFQVGLNTWVYGEK